MKNFRYQLKPLNRFCYSSLEPAILELKQRTLSSAILTHFSSKLEKKMQLNTENVNKNNENQSNVHKTFSLDN